MHLIEKKYKTHINSGSLCWAVSVSLRVVIGRWGAGDWARTQERGGYIESLGWKIGLRW